MEPNETATAGLSDARRALLQKYLRGARARPATTTDAIPPRADGGPAPLSFSQQQMWLHAQLADASLIYNEPVTIHRHGALDVSAFERSFLEIVRRHEAWRTTFAWQGEEGVQFVQPPPARLELPFHDLRNHPQAEAEALRLATADARQPFDLTRGPMYRLRLVRMADEAHRIYLTLHHIIFDGFSLYRVLLPELIAAYEAFSQNKTPALEPLPIQYPDYATWQRRKWQEMPAAHLSYWESTLRDLPTLNLPTDRLRPPVQTYAGAMEVFEVSPTTSAALKTLSQEQGVTSFMTMVAAFAALLHGYTGQEDIAIGGVSSGRNRAETLKLLGCFLNTVPIRCSFSKDKSFMELLARVRTATLGALSHDEVPFELLVQKFARQRDRSRSPLVQALIVVEPPLDPLPSGWDFRHLDVETGTSKFDLQLGLDDRVEGLGGSFIYNSDLFDRETIALLKSRWLSLLDRIAAAPQTRVCELTNAQLPSPVWNETRTDYPRASSIQRLFEEQVLRAPNAAALLLGDAQLTYAELNARANRLAHRLQKLGVARDVPVGLWMERSFEMVIGLLAILKAGGAYVPLDPAYPDERLRLMMDDTQMPVILTQEKTGDRLLPIARENFASESDANLKTDSRPEDLAYIMYTSGSTGRPKGVAVPHRAVVRLVRNTNYATFSPNEIFLQLAPISFDAATFEIWGALLNGGHLALMSPAPPALEEIGQAIARHGVTTLWLTSGLFNAMVDERLDDLRPLRQLLAGGDVLSLAHVRKARRALPQTRLINGYGPTESTTFACCHTIDEATPLDVSIPIGRPIANTTAYILDANRKPVPIGTSGELYLGGDGLARGYWRRDELTAEKFVADPFTKEPGARLYRTGDLARWRSDGAIEFLGRADQQIKLRGFRIEPGEIEAALKEQPNVNDAVVVVRKDAHGDKRLVGYVTGPASVPALIEALREKLPDYMVPAAIVPLPALPRTPNGKLDRDALPAPDFAGDESARDFVAPRTPLEEKLADIWTTVLDLEKVGVRDDFFDLGGHSLAGLRIVNRLSDALGERLSPVIFFHAPTVAAMAELLQQKYPAAVARWTGAPATVAALPAIIPRPRREAVAPASLAQRRFWLLDKMPTTNRGDLCLTTFLELDGSINDAALQKAVDLVVARHDALRTSLRLKDGKLQQIVAPERKLGISRRPNNAPFDLARGPLFRLELLTRAASENQLHLNFHGAVADSWSAELVAQELREAYAAFGRSSHPNLREVPRQFADYAVWEQEQLAADRFAKPAETFSATSPADLCLTSRKGTIERLRQNWPRDLIEAAHRLAQKEQTTPGTLFLALWQSLWHARSSEQEFFTLSPNPERSRGDRATIVGPMENPLWVRARLAGNPTFREFVRRTAEAIKEAAATSATPFDLALDGLKLMEIPASFSWKAQETFTVRGGEISPLEAQVIDGGATFEIVYDSARFNRTNMETMLADYEKLLRAALAKPEQPLSALVAKVRWIADRPLPTPVEPTPTAESVRPYLGLQLQLLTIWKEILGLNELGIRDNFFALGGNSLLTLRMLHRAEVACGQPIFPEAFFRDPTIETLASEIARAAMTESATMLRINDTGARTPFFYLHGDLSGGGFYSLKLSRALGPDQPFYVMPPQDVRMLKEAPSIPEMAAMHLEELRKVRPHGPYIIGGFCLGALVAYELAQQIVAGGETVEMLLLIDAAPEDKALAALRRLSVNVARVRHWDQATQIEHFRQWALRRTQFSMWMEMKWPMKARLIGRQILNRLPSLTARPIAESTAAPSKTGLEQERDMPSAFVWASAGYQPQPYAGPVAVLLSEDLLHRGDHLGAAWQQLAPQVQVHPLKGSHLECITAHVDDLAETMERTLK